MHRIKDAFLDPDATELTVQTDPQKCSLGRWIYADSTVAMKDHDYQFQSLWVKLEQFHRDLHMTATSISDTLQHGAREEAIRFYRKQTQRAAKDSLATIDQILTWHGSQIEGMETAKAIYATETVPSLHKVQHLLKKIRETARAHIMTDEAMLQAAEATRRNVSVAGLTAVTIGTLLAFFIARGIVGVLRRISGQVDEGAEQVASASGQVSSASQSLAGGASEQAASLEETSSSLEEMASMTRQNADNANQANQFMDNTNRIVADASREMQDLDRSMGDISEASQETKKSSRPSTK